MPTKTTTTTKTKENRFDSLQKKIDKLEKLCISDVEALTKTVNTFNSLLLELQKQVKSNVNSNGLTPLEEELIRRRFVEYYSK